MPVKALYCAIRPNLAGARVAEAVDLAPDVAEEVVGPERRAGCINDTM
jgi:hypothetical protein